MEMALTPNRVLGNGFYALTFLERRVGVTTSEAFPASLRIVETSRSNHGLTTQKSQNPD